MKPHAQKEILIPTSYTNGMKETVQTSGGIDVEARMVISEENGKGEMTEWIVENVKFSIKKPVNISFNVNIIPFFFLIKTSVFANVAEFSSLPVGSFRLRQL